MLKLKHLDAALRYEARQAEIANRMDCTPMTTTTASLGPYVFEFASMQAWINGAQQIWRLHEVRADDTVCIDAKGRICRIGRDFMTADKEGQYPIRVYLARDDMPQYQDRKSAAKQAVLAP